MPSADTGASAAVRADAAISSSTSVDSPGSAGSPSTPDSAGTPGSNCASGSRETRDRRPGPASETPAKLRPGGPGYRRMSFALFAAGVSTFALLYSTQALLPAISDDLRVTPDAASWSVAASTFGLALAVVPLSALSERFGRRTMMTASLAVAALIALVLPFVPSLGGLIALRAVQGAALAGTPASAMAFLSEEVEKRALVGAIGLFVAGNSIGGMSGRIVTGWAAQAWGWRVALGVVGLMAVVCAVVFRLMVPPARHFVSHAVGPRAFLRTVAGHLSNPLLCRLYAIGALFMTVFGGVYTVIGYRLVGEPFSLPQGIVGSIFVIYLVGTVSSAVSGRLVGRLGRRGALYLAVGTTTAGLLISLLDALPAVLAGLVLITAGFFAGHAVASSAVSHAVTTARAQASALYQSAYYVGSSVGGALGAAAFHAGGWAATVSIGLVAMAAATAVTLYATRKAAVASRTRVVSRTA